MLAGQISCLSPDVKRLHYQKDMSRSKWEPLDTNHHCANFEAFMSCQSGDTKLFYHVI